VIADMWTKPHGNGKVLYQHSYSAYGYFCIIPFSYQIMQ
jgi:hypothetical protein